MLLTVSRSPSAECSLGPVRQSTLPTLTDRDSEPEPPVSIGQRAQPERARDRYAMARKYAGINVKTQETSTEPNIPNVKTSCCVNFSVSLVNLDA